jgi:hypothetical protein
MNTSVMNLEGLALKSVESRHGLQLHRNRKDIIRKMAELFECDEETTLTDWKEYCASLFIRSVVPDGWALLDGDSFEWDNPNAPDDIHRVIAVEVEDTHALSMDKMLRYGHMWWAFDGTEEFELEVLVVDRYGANPRWLNTICLGYLSLPFAKQQEKSIFDSFGGLTRPGPKRIEVSNFLPLGDCHD